MEHLVLKTWLEFIFILKRLLTLFSDLWGDKKRYPKLPLEKPLTLKSQQNMSLSNVQISVLEMHIHTTPRLIIKQ